MSCHANIRNMFFDQKSPRVKISIYNALKLKYKFYNCLHFLLPLRLLACKDSWARGWLSKFGGLVTGDRWQVTRDVRVRTLCDLSIYLVNRSWQLWKQGQSNQCQALNVLRKYWESPEIFCGISVLVTF